MPEMNATTPAASQAEALLTAVAAAVLAVPGVIRLEPTISTSGPALLVRRNATDGIRLLTRAGAAEVDVNIAITAASQARAVTHHIQASLGDLLRTHGYQPGTISVSVLAIEPGPTA